MCIYIYIHIWYMHIYLYTCLTMTILSSSQVMSCRTREVNECNRTEATRGIACLLTPRLKLYGKKTPNVLSDGWYGAIKVSCRSLNTWPLTPWSPMVCCTNSLFFTSWILSHAIYCAEPFVLAGTTLSFKKVVTLKVIKNMQQKLSQGFGV